LILGIEGNPVFAAQAWGENLHSTLPSVYWEPTERHQWSRIQEIVCKVWGTQWDFHQSKQRFWIHQAGETYNYICITFINLADTFIQSVSF